MMKSASLMNCMIHSLFLKLQSSFQIPPADLAGAVLLSFLKKEGIQECIEELEGGDVYPSTWFDDVSVEEIMIIWGSIVSRAVSTLLIHMYLFLVCLRQRLPDQQV
jgi:hypothetical protein